jgi:sulfatase modifying factor 1
MMHPSNGRLVSPIAILALCTSMLLLATGAVAHAITIPTVPVGNTGNAGDVQPDGTFGAVAYDYLIGTTEVTVGQYTAFLSAVAATDTYGLYNPSMATNLHIAGISQSGSSGNYTYNVIGSPNKPATYVSWGDAARFANWLHNGQPTGVQGPGTTEDGAYTLNGAVTNAALNAVTRNSSAVWFITSEDEWYKAAYHKNDGVTGNYWDYPTSTDSVPYSDQPPGSDAPTQSNTANFYSNDGLANFYNDGFAVTGAISPSSSQNYLTDVGAYALSTSPYGTFDQGGNIFEWNEFLYAPPTTRGLRGGSWANDSNTLSASFRFSVGLYPTDERHWVGFRVATVPEPSTGVLAIVAYGFLWVLRKRFK